MRRLLQDGAGGKLDVVVVSYRDRLARFGIQVHRNGVLLKFVAISSTNDQCRTGLVGLSIFEMFWKSYLLSALLGFECSKERIPRLLEFL
ncbi:MAG: hypothetical protein ACFFD2_08205 [Promethearchaeota archaeon]